MATTRPVALVTGASSGIGKETARAFVAAGFEVIGTGRRTSGLTPPAGVTYLDLDVGSDDSATAAVGEVIDRYGRPCSTTAIGPARDRTAQPLPATGLQRPGRRRVATGTAGAGYVRHGPRRPPRTASELRAASHGARSGMVVALDGARQRLRASPAAGTPPGTVTGGEPSPSAIQWRPR
ncbi:NAD(P)-dependent dehydrogenase (short-subunit alcohol dehydrogenase family) [Streptomyces sp. SAI-126]